MTYPIPKPREKSRWSNLSQGSLPLALARYLPHKRLKVVLTQDAEQALRLQTAWRFFRPHDTAVFLPDWETLPYERFSPHQDLVSERLSALWQIKSGAADVLFVPVATAMQKLPPVPFLAGRTFWLKTGQTLDIGRLKTDLVDAGYNHVSHVVAAGEFAVRGGIVDLFPMGSEMPYRIDLFDDEIDSIKTFDTDTQRTISPVSEIRLLPAHEFPTDSEAQKIFRSRFREEVDGNPNDAAVYKAVSNGHFGAGVEYYLPLFFENELETLFDYIGEDALFVSLGDVHAEANRFWSDVKSRYAMAQGDETYPPLLPQHLYLSADVFAGRLKNYGQVLPDVSGKEHALPDLAVNRQSDEPLQALKDFQTAFEGRILLCAESLGRRETMLGFLQQNGLKAKPVSDWQGFLSAHEPLMITVAPLAYGFKLGGLQSPNQQQTTSASEGEGDAVAAQTNFSATAANPLPNPLPQEREQSAAASAVSNDLHPANPQQTAPSPVGEGWGEGKTVAAQTNFSATAANPLPQEGEQSAAASALSDDPQPQKQPASQKGRLKPLPLADIRTFQAWLKTAERENPRLLFLSRDDLMQHAAAHITEEQFPKFWQTADGKFKLSYRFEPHHPLDGVTLTLPLTVLNRISPAALEWLVPGMLREKIQLLIKALPKQIRRICVPVPDFITKFLESNPDRQAAIIPQLAHFIAKSAGDMRIFEQIDQDAWAVQELPEHCYLNLRIIDDGGQELAGGRKLHELQQQLGQAAATTFRDNTQEFERDNVTAWDIGTLPESIKFARGKQQLTGYLGLQKEKDGRIALRLCDTIEAAEQAHRQGVIELMKLQLKEQVKDLNKGIQGFTQAAMLLKHINADTLRDDLTQAVCDRAFIGEDELPRNEKAFKEQIKRARSRLPAVKEALSRYLQETAAAYAELNGKLGKHPLTHLLRLRLQTLLAPSFATRTPWAQWPRLPIYLKAMTLRLEKYSSNPARDAAREADIQELEQMWQEKTDSLVKQGLPISDGLAGFKWMIEELRVSLFAQELKTPYPVSVKRLMKEWERLNK